VPWELGVEECKVRGALVQGEGQLLKEEEGFVPET
jgi:hypothetical protein